MNQENSSKRTHRPTGHRSRAFGHHRPATRRGRHDAPALAPALSADGVDVTELIQDAVPDRALPEAAQCFRRGAPNAAHPACVNASFELWISVSLSAWRSIGQANDRTGPTP